jgi:hypothetical protein
MSPRSSTQSKKKTPAAATAKSRKPTRPPTRLSTALEQAVKRGSAVLEGPIIRWNRREAMELAGELKGTLGDNVWYATGGYTKR